MHKNSNQSVLSPLQGSKNSHEVFGFAPYWNFSKLGSTDFSVLTTFAYFGIPVNGDGTFDTTDAGYTTFISKDATTLFQKAHSYGTRVVLTFTDMDNDNIDSLMNDSAAQKKMIDGATTLVAERGIDGINVDFEYVGDPGQDTRNKFTKFVANLTSEMHKKVPSSKVTVSVYATSVKEPKIYDIASLSKVTDGIFMMAYDFATTDSDVAVPTAPLYGYKEGKYWYDISTAVNDFLTVMPANKLILGLPWYGYNYPVDQPGVRQATEQGYYTSYWYNWRKYYQWVAPPPSVAQTYSDAKATLASSDVSNVTTGWDSLGEVNYVAYQEDGAWHEIFLEDQKSLSIKYDFAKDKKLGGVGMWALGMEEGHGELWSLLSAKFGDKLADSAVIDRTVFDIADTN